MSALRHQPDDPGAAICPCCKRPWPDEDGDLERLVKANITKCTLPQIARAASVPLSRVERIASRIRKEPEPRGA